MASQTCSVAEQPSSYPLPHRIRLLVRRYVYPPLLVISIPVDPHKSQFVVAPEPTSPHLGSYPQRVRSIHVAIIIPWTSRQTHSSWILEWPRNGALPVERLSVYPNSSPFSSIVGHLFACWSHIALCCLNDDETRHSFVVRRSSPARPRRHGDVIHIPSNSPSSVVYLSNIRERPVIGETIVVPGAFRSCLSLKIGLSSNGRLSPHNANKPPSPDSHFGLDRALTDARAKTSC